MGRQTENKKKALDWLEQIILSLFLSITIIVLVLFIILQINISLTPSFIISIIILTNAICVVGAWLAFIKRKKHEDTTN